MKYSYLLLVFICACGDVVEETKEKTEDLSNKIADETVCRGILRDSIYTRVDGAVKDYVDGELEVSDLKTIATAYALTLDSNTLIAGNLLSISNAAQKVECGGSLDCEDPVLNESNGEITKTCDGKKESYAFQDGCQLYVTPISGGLEIEEKNWQFSDFQIVDDRFLNGGLVVTDKGVDKLAVKSTTNEGFELSRNEGKSCEETLRFYSLDVSDIAGLELSSSFDRETVSGTDYSVLIKNLAWPDDRSCACPTGGSTNISFSAIRERSIPFSVETTFVDDKGCGKPQVSIPELNAFCEKHDCDPEGALNVVSKVLAGFCQ